MRKISLIVILLAGCIGTSFAQADTVKKNIGYDQYVGVQLNGLIRQVFNFNNSTSSTNVNPYLLNYSINSRRTGWGLRFGIGYNYNSTTSDDGITATTTKLNDLELRLGIEKAFKLSKKWSAGIGIDGVYNTNDDNTKSTVTSSDTTITNTKSNVYSYGGGAMGWLRYHVTDKIMIGTEASFYYTTGKQKQTIDQTEKLFEPNGSGGGSESITTSETKTNNNVSQGIFSSPIVFFIVVKF